MTYQDDITNPQLTSYMIPAASDTTIAADPVGGNIPIYPVNDGGGTYHFAYRLPSGTVLHFATTSSPVLTAPVEIDAATLTVKGLILKTTDDNTAHNLFEIQSSAAALLANITAQGKAAFAAIDSTPIGATTPAAGTFSALTETIGGFKGIFTHANSADRTYTFPNYDATVATIAGLETLTNKTLTTPTIGNFTNAQHNHQNAAGGGSLDAAALGSGVLDNARVNWASPSAIGSGTPAAITGTVITANTKFVGSALYPPSDSTTALSVINAANTVTLAVIDSANYRIGVGPNAPTKRLDVQYGGLNFTYLTAPGAPTVALAGAGAGSVPNGTYTYKVTLVDNSGETTGGTASASVTVTNNAVDGKVALSNIPTGPVGYCTARNIYRATASTYTLVGTINDNTTTTFTDNAAAGTTALPTENQSAGQIFVNGTQAAVVTSTGEWLFGNAAQNPIVNALVSAARAYVDPTTTSEIYNFTATATYSADNAQQLIGLAMFSIANQSGKHLTNAVGASIGAQISGQCNGSSGTADNAIGLYTLVRNTGAGGIITTAKSINALVQLTSTGTITNGYGVYVQSPSNVGGGTLVNMYGVYVEAQTGAGTLNYAIFTNAGLVHFGDNVEMADAKNFVFNTTTGTKIGTATSQKLAFWNKTPIVQPTNAITAAAFVANTSGIANDTATFGGYTIGQMAAALINSGMLA